MIGSVIKYFRFTFDYVLYDISFCNLQMLLSTIPIPKTEPAKPQEGEVAQSDDGAIEVGTVADFMKLGIK